MPQPIIRTLPSLFTWQAITVVAGFVAQVVLARSLGPTNKGVLDLFLVFPFVASSVLEMGLLSANTYFAGKGTHDLQTLHTNSLLWSLTTGSLLVLLGLVVSFTIGSPFASLSETFFLLALVSVVPSLYFSLWSGLMYGTDEVKRVYLVSGASSMLSLVAYGALAAAGGSLVLFVYVTTGLFLAKALFSFSVIRTKVSLRAHLHFRALKQSLLYGLALYVGLAINSLHFRINQFFIESIMGPTDLGYFALAVRIAEFVWLTDYVVVTASLYRVTSEDSATAILVTQRTLKLVAFLVLMLSLGIFALAPIAVPLLFGKAFAPAVLPLWLLLPGIVAWSLGRSLSPFISYQCGKPWYNTAIAAVAFCINIVANLVLIPKMGTIGAAIASTISYTFNLLLVLMIFLRLSGARLADTFLPSKAEVAVVGQFLREKLHHYSSRGL